MPPEVSGGASGEPAGAAPRPGGLSPDDLQHLTEKVYALMVADVRLGHARVDSTVAHQRRVED